MFETKFNFKFPESVNCYKWSFQETTAKEMTVQK